MLFAGSTLLLKAVVLCIAIKLTKSLTCKKRDECSCRFDDKDGKIVQLRPLARNDGKPLFLDQKATDGDWYSYNPCYAFEEDSCSKAAVCQRLGVNGTTKTIVGQANVQFGYDGRNVQVTYIETDPVPRIAVVSYVCVENLTPPKFTAYGMDNTSKIFKKQYKVIVRRMWPKNFQVETMCACGNVCYTAPEEGISAGSVLLIIFFVLVALYFFTGTAHGIVVRNASGMAILPHHEFWTSLPGLVKNGTIFVVSCACCTTKPKPYDGI